MDGVLLLSSDASRTLRKYPLSHIARWALRGPSLVLYTRSPSDAGERAVTLAAASEAGAQTLLDTLTCCCMQMVELLQADADAEDAAATARARRPRGGLPDAPDVAWWEDADKAGWLQSQGDHIKTWRRRWHVLKDGWLFRFASPDDAARGGPHAASPKPRGVLDLTLVTDVGDGRDATGKANSIRLATSAGGAVCYVADSETDAVEWVSALDAAVARVLRALAGVDGGGGRQSNASTAAADWGSKLAAGYGAAAGGGGGGGGSAPPPPRATPHPPSVVTVDYGGGGSSAPPSAPVAPGASYGGYGGGYGGEGGIAAGGIAGVAGVVASGGRDAYTGFASTGAYPSLPADATINVAVPAYTPTAQPAAHTTQFGGGVPEPAYRVDPTPHHPPPPATAPPPSLPPPWQVHYTAEGAAYYFNAATRETQWHPPPSASLV